MVTTILGGFYVIGNSTILFVMHGEDLQVYLQTHLYGVSDKHFTKQLQYVIAFVDALLFCILIRGINIFTGLFYIFVCRVIASNFSTLNDILKAAALKNNITPNAVRRFRKLHTELADLVITIDDIVNFILFCWYSTILFDLCIDIYYFFIFESKTHDDQAQRTTAGILDLYRFTYSLVFFLSTSFSAANVTEEAHASLPLVHKLTDEQAITDWELQEQTLLLSAQLTAPEVGFTGWHFFYIDRSFILSVTGVVISFCVVIVQMNTSPTSSTGPTH
ncbi:gustatory receptor for sugar taste 64f-like [Tachypleus tridentatus]|uniref:gustatory receptor for sugar taste 64f-like n=1 Tax=Tachypleus tridentatus TaxID=6853 RepID=UPI003FD526EB